MSWSEICASRHDSPLISFSSEICEKSFPMASMLVGENFDGNSMIRTCSNPNVMNSATLLEASHSACFAR